MGSFKWIITTYRELSDYFGVGVFLMQVLAETLYTDINRVEKGIVELISLHDISKLVMGAAADKHYSRYKPHRIFSQFFHCITNYAHLIALYLLFGPSKVQCT